MAIFNLFCLGTGHTSVEANQTMFWLHRDCLGVDKVDKLLVDGPTGPLGIAFGAGMDPELRDIIKTIKGLQPPPEQINMAGHSRGAVLCHMTAHALSDDQQTQNIPITIAALDPVNMSLGHEGVDTLHSNVIRYQAIIMENENMWEYVTGGTTFPLQFVERDDEDEGKIYYINMPGKHGSGTQVLTSAIGKVCYELIANFMRRRGTQFGSPAQTALKMCELFAEIHRENGWTDQSRTMRTIFDDDGASLVHDRNNSSAQGFDLRAKPVMNALERNLKASGLGNNRKDAFMSQFGHKSYFINQKHVKFFKKEFPFLWSVIAGNMKISASAYEQEIRRMRFQPALNQSLPLLWELIYSRMPQGFLIPDEPSQRAVRQSAD